MQHSSIYSHGFALTFSKYKIASNQYLQKVEIWSAQHKQTKKNPKNPSHAVVKTLKLGRFVTTVQDKVVNRKRVNGFTIFGSMSFPYTLIPSERERVRAAVTHQRGGGDDIPVPHHMQAGKQKIISKEKQWEETILHWRSYLSVSPIY